MKEIRMKKISKTMFVVLLIAAGISISFLYSAYQNRQDPRAAKFLADITAAFESGKTDIPLSSLTSDFDWDKVCFAYIDDSDKYGAWENWTNHGTSSLKIPKKAYQYLFVFYKNEVPQNYIGSTKWEIPVGSQVFEIVARPTKQNGHCYDISKAYLHQYKTTITLHD